MDQSTWPEHLRDDAPYQRCDRCGRKTWSRKDFEGICTMPRWDGAAWVGQCGGRFRGSGANLMDQATAELWRQLAVNLTRCEHGRVQLDSCFSCPDGISPDQSGRGLGYSLDGACRLVVPPRERMSDVHAWYVRLVP